MKLSESQPLYTTAVRVHSFTIGIGSEDSVRHWIFSPGKGQTEGRKNTNKLKRGTREKHDVINSISNLLAA